jgi:hypothetical protein
MRFHGEFLYRDFICRIISSRIACFAAANSFSAVGLQLTTKDAASDAPDCIFMVLPVRVAISEIVPNC